MTLNSDNESNIFCQTKSSKVLRFIESNFSHICRDVEFIEALRSFIVPERSHIVQNALNIMTHSFASRKLWKTDDPAKLAYIFFCSTCNLRFGNVFQDSQINFEKISKLSMISVLFATCDEVKVIDVLSE